MNVSKYDALKNRPYIGGGKCKDAFWRLLVKDVIQIGGHHSGVTQYRRVVPTDLRIFLRELGQQDGLHFALPLSMADQRFFVTKRGFIGQGPVDVEIGDHVYVLFGSRVPFVLRPVDARSGAPGTQHSRSFQYIGDAYVHGIMDGEALYDVEAPIEIVSLE
ncbi:uncharacterized protein K452DRAFT_107214 [Aplosporella prunicola CBS 121167]|uniref:Uncharacterized protein n=1 Tax=Aplosporella prunicola CBS 121167 TaxID=1176127 RepID=A0A6A6BQB1_9PEZI|nr:uncharacterized protein K452DRAFT_107214 [Aplosporella prunicola CBS 121167]KAF2146190.1 hypothetical protein K452DRAFT_107214 [Aplosporella prunicola CBS 121167]